MTDTLTKRQQQNALSLKHYHENKEVLNSNRLKNQHRADLGKELVDNIYTKCDNDQKKIKPIIAYLRAKKRSEEFLSCMSENIQQFML
jgi:hypothetical protein